MSKLPSRFIFRRLGTMSYTVNRRSDSAYLGDLWRTREGWRYRADGQVLLTEVYGLSRETSAGLLSQSFDALHAVVAPRPAPIDRLRAALATVADPAEDAERGTDELDYLIAEVSLYLESITS